MFGCELNALNAVLLPGLANIDTTRWMEQIFNITWKKLYPLYMKRFQYNTLSFLSPSSRDVKTLARDVTLFLGTLYCALSPNLSTMTASGNRDRTYSSNWFILCSTDSEDSFTNPVFNFISRIYPLPNLFFKCCVGPKHLQVPRNTKKLW